MLVFFPYILNVLQIVKTLCSCEMPFSNNHVEFFSTSGFALFKAQNSVFTDLNLKWKNHSFEKL